MLPHSTAFILSLPPTAFHHPPINALSLPPANPSHLINTSLTLIRTLPDLHCQILCRQVYAPASTGMQHQTAPYTPIAQSKCNYNKTATRLYFLLASGSFALPQVLPRKFNSSAAGLCNTCVLGMLPLPGYPCPIAIFVWRFDAQRVCVRDVCLFVATGRASCVT